MVRKRAIAPKSQRQKAEDAIRYGPTLEAVRERSGDRCEAAPIFAEHLPELVACEGRLHLHEKRTRGRRGACILCTPKRDRISEDRLWAWAMSQSPPVSPVAERSGAGRSPQSTLPVPNDEGGESG